MERSWLNAQVRAIKKLEKDDLDFTNAGQWPRLIQAMALLLLVSSSIAASHWLVISRYQHTLTLAKAEQINLLDTYRHASLQAANLTAYQQQMHLMEATFIQLLAFLPSENEVPHLLDNIQQQAAQQHLEILAFHLKKPEAQHFYTQFAFEIKIRGDFHRLNHFLASISSLDRLVTLHNFSLQPDTTDAQLLTLNIEAQTYRYDPKFNLNLNLSQQLSKVTGRQF